jgi:Flp pilus assembly protein TadB
VQPRSEPEIIPPGNDSDRHDSDRHSSRDRRHRGPRVAFDARAFERVYVARPRPLAALVAALALGAVALVLVVCLLGVVLVALPAIVTVAAIALITAYFRGTRRQLR